MENSRFENNGVWGLFTNHANNVEVIEQHDPRPSQQHGIYFSNSGDGGRIADNYIVGFDACGIQLNGDKSMGGARGVSATGSSRGGDTRTTSSPATAASVAARSISTAAGTR
jgi:hypothetical protein